MIHSSHRIYEGGCDFAICTVCHQGHRQGGLEYTCPGPTLVREMHIEYRWNGHRKEQFVKEPEPRISSNVMGRFEKTLVIIGLIVIIVSYGYGMRVSIESLFL